MAEQQVATQSGGGSQKPPGNTITTSGGQPPQKHPIVVLRERLIARSDELRASLGEIPVETFIRAVVTSAQINQDILACSWASLWNACMRACRDNLLPDGVEGAIVPYKSTAQWIPMYRGMVRQFMRSGTFRWIGSHIVREGEEFANWIDETGERFKHVPGMDISAKMIAVYGAATTKDGAFFLAVLPVEEANKIRMFSKNTRDDAPWKNWPEEMYKKTALRRLAKLLPSMRDALPSLREEDFPPEVAAVLAEPVSDQQADDGKAGGDGAPLDQGTEQPKQQRASDERSGKS